MSTIPHTQPQRKSHTVATPATVTAYLDEGHTQLEAAHFFGISERTIRNRLAEYRLTAAETVQEPIQHRSRRLRRIDRPHHHYVRPVVPVVPVGTKRFVPIAPHLIAGQHTSWCAWDGELRPVVPGTTGAAWNAEQKRLQQTGANRQRQPMPATEAATIVPDLPPVELDLPPVAAVTQPLPPIATEHNTAPTISLRDDYARQRVTAQQTLVSLPQIDWGQLVAYAGPVLLVAFLVVAMLLSAAR